MSGVEEDFFKLTETPFKYSNLTKGEWQTVRSLANGRSIVIMEADKGFSFVIWDRVIYMKETERQLPNANV